jgi:hypothetical protein
MDQYYKGGTSERSCKEDILNTEIFRYTAAIPTLYVMGPLNLPNISLQTDS